MSDEPIDSLQDPANEWSRLESLFHHAMTLPGPERDAWIADQLSQHPAQARLLQRMLAHAANDATGLTDAIHRVARDASAPRDRSGEQIGRYRLIARIRYGGMAEIYRAARDDGEFEREVALKVVRSDLADARLSALFAVERALLARLKHPNIIEIFDGGTTPTGEAWFVMSLLDGLPLLAAIQQHKLGTDQILGHLIDLCAAVVHAHGQFIVHRDIKPENILLNHAGQSLHLTLLDFGIAAQLAEGASVNLAPENSGGQHGWHSPGYTAPETREGQPCGAATDIYSIGRVVLDCVVHVAPRFREELRAIGEKASCDNPADRYASTSSLAEDLERLRRREPISLFRHRRLHVLSRAIERHRWAVAAALVLVLAGAVWAVRESQLRIKAQQATTLAEAERDRAGAMRDFLLDVFHSGNPRLNQGEDPRVSELIVGQLEQLEKAKDLDPDAHFDLLSTFADLLLHQGQRDLANRAYTQAMTLTESQGGKGNMRWAAMATRLGQLAAQGARFEESDRWFKQAEEAIDRWPISVERAEVASVLYSAWGASSQRRDRLDDAERYIRKGLEAKPILKAANNPGGDDAAMRVTLGSIQSARGNQAGALETFQIAYDAHRAAGLGNTLEHLALLGWLGITQDRLGEAAKAEPYLIEAIALAENLFPEPHSKLSGSYGNLGRFYLGQGRLAEAAPLLLRAVEVSNAAGESGTPEHASRIVGLGNLAFELERYDEAIAHCEQAVSLLDATVGPKHQRTLSARVALFTARAETQADARLLKDAETTLADIGKAPVHVEALLLAARLAALNGDRRKAEVWLIQADELRKAAQASSPIDTANRMLRRAQVVDALEGPQPAIAAFLQAAVAFQQAELSHHPARGRALLRAALLHPPGSRERARLGDEARQLLTAHLAPPARSLSLIEGL